MLRMGAITQVSALFTDREPPQGIRALLVEHGVALHVAR
jgi:DeoR family glycerol-3-phosphate regulon repressor